MTNPQTISIFLGAALALAACRDNAEAPARVGQAAPALTLPDETGAQVSLATFRGKQPVMLAFYPRDFTSG